MPSAFARRSSPALTRRDFLGRVARYGGAAVLGTMFGLDLLARDERFHLQLEGRAPGGRNNRVIILGGGVAGLCAAYELGKLGYTCTLLEARARPGGRNWTIRRGTEETELGNPKQFCQFDAGLFYNGGPMRIPHHHTTTLGYCREFGIPLTVFTNFNEGAYIVRKGLPKVHVREVVTDMSGYMSELLAKVVKKGELDATLTKDDREKFIEYLRYEGRLDDNLLYQRAGDTLSPQEDRHNPRGYTRQPGAVGGPGEATVPLDFEALVKAGYADHLDFLKNLNQQPTMLTPTDGMDRIPFAFAERLGDVVHYNSPVREIRRTASGGVRIAYHDGRAGGAAREIEGDYCICTLPPILVRKLPNDFAPATQAVLQLMKPACSGKIGLQFKRRFWEEDDDIYGGCSKTEEEIMQVYYPFDGYGSHGKGIMVGYYHFGLHGAKELIDDRTPAEREKVALEQGARIHPQYPKEFENSFSVAWHRVPHNESPWMQWENDADYEKTQRVVRAADGPFYFAGDWASHSLGWQAGAFVSAHRAIADLHQRACAS